MSDAFLRWTYPFRPKDVFEKEPPERFRRVCKWFSPGGFEESVKIPSSSEQRRVKTLFVSRKKPPFRDGIILSGRPPGGTGGHRGILLFVITAVFLTTSIQPGALAADMMDNHINPYLRGGVGTSFNFSPTPPAPRVLTDDNDKDNATTVDDRGTSSSVAQKKDDSAASYPTILHEQLKLDDNLDKPTLYYLLFASILLLLRRCLCFPCRKICCRKKKKKNIEKMKFNDWEAWDDEEWEAFELAVTTPSPKDDAKTPKNKKKLAKEAKNKAKMDKQTAKEAKIKEKAEKAEAKAAKKKKK